MLQMNTLYCLGSGSTKYIFCAFQRPRSMCNDHCQPGFRKGIQQGKPACCYDCIKCAEGQISNVTGMNMKCPYES